MNITPANNAGIPAIQNNIKNRAGIYISEEALEKLETSIRERRFDSFEPGEGHGIRKLEEADYEFGGKPQLSTTFTESRVSEKARSLSMLMDERADRVYSQVGFSLTVDRDRLCEHFGEIGRKLDEAYSAGEISKQEYEDLNAGLQKYTETVTSREERRTAVFEVLKKNARAMDAMMQRGASQKEIEEFARWNRETLEDRISDFIKNNSAYDRSLMAQLIQRVRTGQNNKEKQGKEPTA